MDLPLEPLEPTEVNPKILVLYGPEKIGKTTLLSQLPDKYLILESDRYGEGANFIKCTRTSIIKYNDHTEVCDQVIKMGKPYKFGVMDTASTFEDLCEVDATKEYKSSNAGKAFNGRSVLELVGPDYNPGYRWVRLSFQKALNKMVQAFPYVIIVCHIKDKYIKVEDKDKGKSDSIVRAGEIDLAGKLRGMLCKGADSTGFIYRTDSTGGQKIWVDFRTNDVVSCGTRALHLIQANFEFDWRRIYLPNK